MNSAGGLDWINLGQHRGRWEGSCKICSIKGVEFDYLSVLLASQV